MLGGMFRRTRHKQFDYKPRYYDPIRDDLEQRVQAREITHVDNREVRRLRIAEGMRRNQGITNIRKESTIRSNVLIGLVAAILALMAYLLLGDLSFLSN